MFSTIWATEERGSVAAAICGVASTRGCDHSGEDAGSGSVRRAGKLAAVERRQQILLHQVLAAADVDDVAAPRHRREGAGVQDAGGVRRQRQHADHDLAARQEPRQVLRPGEAAHAGDLLRPARPAGDVEAQPRQGPRHRAADLAQAHDADRAIGSLLERQLLPNPCALLLLVDRDLAVEAQRVEHRVLHHLGGQPGVDHAHDRQVARQRRVLEQVVDTGPEREDHLEVRQRCQQAGRRVPYQRVLDLRGIADVGIEPEREIGQRLAELRAPPRAAVAGGPHQQGHRERRTS